MKKCRYMPTKEDPNLFQCTRCGRIEYGRLPVDTKHNIITAKCPNCRAIVRVPKKCRATKHGIMACQGWMGDGVYLYERKKFLGRFAYIGRLSSSELARLIDVYIELKKARSLWTNQER